MSDGSISVPRTRLRFGRHLHAVDVIVEAVVIAVHVHLPV